jgi:predicted nucleic acid-binding protein
VKPVLLDTGCIVALLDRSEAHHQACVEAASLLEGPLVTCEAVVAESCYLLRRLPGAPEAVVENVARDLFLVPFRLSGTAPRVMKLMKKYRDVPMDFADACLVSLAETLGTGRILTLDRDFRVYRWGRNRPFELVVDPGEEGH